MKICFVLMFILFPLLTYSEGKPGMQFAGYLGASLLNRSSQNTFATNGSVVLPATVESTYENSASGGIELRWINSQSWIYRIGARSMPYRKVESANLIINSSVIQPLIIISPYSYKLTSAYLTTGYCWDSFYLQLGFSYNIFDFSSPASTVPFRTKNGTGGIFGFGYKMSDNWSIEYTGYSALVSIESGVNYQTEDKLTFSDAVLSLNYGF